MSSILIVDDNEDLREIYGSVLRHEGYVVDEAEDGAQALSMLEGNCAPCLLLLDLVMPVMGGAELLRLLSDSGRLAKLPVIVLSATGRATDAPEANMFIRKPVDSHVLVSLARAFCESGAQPT